MSEGSYCVCGVYKFGGHRLFWTGFGWSFFAREARTYQTNSIAKGVATRLKTTTPGVDYISPTLACLY